LRIDRCEEPGAESDVVSWKETIRQSIGLSAAILSSGHVRQRHEYDGETDDEAWAHSSIPRKV